MVRIKILKLRVKIANKKTNHKVLCFNINYEVVVPLRN